MRVMMVPKRTVRSTQVLRCANGGQLYDFRHVGIFKPYL
jgi:hypothetical protein